MYFKSNWRPSTSDSSTAASDSMSNSNDKTARDAVTSLSPTSNITPYLGLNARLSQTWINKWTVLLLLVLARTIIAIIGLNGDIGSARREALSACTSVENVGSAMASMPHYLSSGVNELTATGVDKAVKGLMDMLTLTVTGVEEIVVFVINLLTSTYVCLITLVVAGSLHAAIALIEDTTSFLNKTLGAIGGDIQKGVSDFETDLDKAIGTINGLLKDVGSSVSIPTLNIDGSLSELDHLQLPSGLDADLRTLNNSIPTFAEVNNLTNTAIRWPFEEIKKLIQEHTSNYTFDRSQFPVPAKEALTFCSDNNDIGRFFDDMIETAIVFKEVAIIILCVLATLACIPMAYREMRRWRTMKQRSELISAGTYDNMDVVYIVSRPYTATAGIKLANGFESTRRQALVRWVIAYATTVPALFVLSLGIAGLFSCLCQYILLRAIEREVPNLETEIVNFADKIVYALNNASTQWQNGTNTAILDVQKTVNNDLFSWVNISASALNNTLNTFVDESIKVLNLTFGGTVLYEPVTGLFECLIGLKVAGIEKALTWVSDNAYIDFPLLPNNTFSLGAALSKANDTTAASFLANPQSGATDEISSIVDRLTNKLADGIRTEVFISLTVVGVWFVLVLIGVIRALFLWFGSDDDTDAGHSSMFKDIHSEDAFSNDGKFNPAATNGVTPISAPIRGVASSDRTGQESSDTLSNSGNQYKGTSYTLKPQAFPTFDSTSPPKASTFATDSSGHLMPVRENLGYAGARAVGGAVKRPTNFRRSSHAAMGGLGGGPANQSVNF